MKGVLAASAVAAIVALLGTPLAIGVLVEHDRRRGRAAGPTSGWVEGKTPRMGGVVVVVAVWAGYLCAHAVAGRLPAEGLGGSRAVGVLGWAYPMVAATSTAVDLTDGLDGLATGAAAMVFGAYTLIGVWQSGHACRPVGLEIPGGGECYPVSNALDLAVVAAAVMGACFGFLWWNTAPAKISLGATGSWALGGALAGLAITTRTELLSVLLGGLFVVVAVSAAVQVGVYRLTNRRVFRMAPLHHHLEMVGWAQTTVVVRFWILAGLCVAGGLGLFYAEWLSGT